MAKFARLNGREQAQLDLWLDWDANRKEGKKMLPFLEHLQRMDKWLEPLDHTQDWMDELHRDVKRALKEWTQ